MSYIFFKHDGINNIDNFSNSLATSLWLSQGNLRCKLHRSSFQVLSKYDLERVYDYDWLLSEYFFTYKNNFNNVFYVYSDTELKTDKYLVGDYGDKYLGIVENAVDIKTVIKLLKLVYKLFETEELKKSLRAKLDAIKKNEFIALSDVEYLELVKIIGDSNLRFFYWCDERIYNIKADIDSTSTGFKRNF